MFGAMFGGASSGEGSSSPVSSPTGFSGHLNAMNYSDKDFKGELRLTSPEAIGKIIGATEWVQGRSYQIHWEALGDFPFIEVRLRKAGKDADQHITLPGEGKKKEWLNIAERVQAGRSSIIYTVPQFLQPGRYLLRISARPRSKVNHIRSEAYVVIQEDLSEFATSMLRVLDADLSVIPEDKKRSRLMVHCGSAGSIPLHVFAVLCKHVYESSEKATNARTPEQFPFWDRINKLSAATYFPPDAESSTWCSSQRHQNPILEQTRRPGPEFEGFELVETHTHKVGAFGVGLFEGLKAQAWKRVELDGSRGPVYVIVFRGTKGTMDYLVDMQVYREGNADMYVNEGMSFVTKIMRQFGLGPRHIVVTGHSLGANVAAEVANAFGCRAVGFCLPMLCGDRRNYQDLTVCNIFGDPVALAFTGLYNHLLPGRDILLQYDRSFIGPSELHSSDRLARQLYVTFQETRPSPEELQVQGKERDADVKPSSPTRTKRPMSPTRTLSAADAAAEAEAAAAELRLSQLLLSDLDNVAKSPRSPKSPNSPKKAASPS